MSSASSTSCSSSERRVLDERIVGIPSLADDEKVFFVDEEGMRRGEGSEPPPSLKTCSSYLNQSRTVVRGERDKRLWECFQWLRWPRRSRSRGFRPLA